MTYSEAIQAVLAANLDREDTEALLALVDAFFGYN